MGFDLIFGVVGPPGPGVFFRLPGLHLKARFPTRAVYGPTSDAELRLITCGGAFDLVALGESGAFDFLLEPGAEEQMRG